jgi:hypothetical protein
MVKKLIHVGDGYGYGHLTHLAAGVAMHRYLVDVVSVGVGRGLEVG